jgi:hypothetical protein
MIVEAEHHTYILETENVIRKNRVVHDELSRVGTNTVVRNFNLISDGITQ